MLEVGERTGMLRERRDPRGQRRQEHHDHDDAKAEHRSSVAGECIPGPPQVLPGAGMGDDQMIVCASGRGRHAHVTFCFAAMLEKDLYLRMLPCQSWYSRIRGSRYPTRMSMRQSFTT